VGVELRTQPAISRIYPKVPEVAAVPTIQMARTAQFSSLRAIASTAIMMAFCHPNTAPAALAAARLHNIEAFAPSVERAIPGVMV